MSQENHTELWKSVLAEVELSISHAAFMTWFKKTQLDSIDDDIVYIRAVTYELVLFQSHADETFLTVTENVVSETGFEPADLSPPRRALYQTELHGDRKRLEVEKAGLRRGI